MTALKRCRSLQVSASLVNLSLAYGALGDLKGQARATYYGFIYIYYIFCLSCHTSSHAIPHPEIRA